MHDFLVVLVILLGLFGLAAFGFYVFPRPYQPHPVPSRLEERAPLNLDLPEPVYRHFHETLGDSPPLIHTAVIWGRGKIRLKNVWMPFRFKGWYRPGESFIRRMVLTWYRRPLLRGQDSLIGDQGTFALAGRSDQGEWVDQNERLNMWAQAVCMPAVFVHDPRVHWEPVDEETARLVINFGERTDHLLAHFDGSTGRMTHLSGLRFAEDAPEKEPWRVDLLAWKDFYGMLIPCQFSVAWGESGSPWSYWNIDGVAYNVNVSDQLGESSVTQSNND